MFRLSILEKLTVKAEPHPSSVYEGQDPCRRLGTAITPKKSWDRQWNELVNVS